MLNADTALVERTMQVCRRYPHVQLVAQRLELETAPDPTCRRRS